MSAATRCDYVGIVIVLTLIVVSLLAMKVARHTAEADIDRDVHP